MKWKAILLVALVLADTLIARVSATPVRYWFTGVVESVANPSNAIPFTVSIGAPFAGRLTYDPAVISFSNVNSYPEGDTGFYYFTNTEGYSIVFQIAGHTVTNVTRLGRNTGLIGVYDQYNNEDSYWAQSSGSLTIDGNPYLSDPLFSGIYIYLDDDSKTALNSTAIPTEAPVLDKFTSHRDLTWGAYIDDGGPTQLFSVEGTLTRVSTNELALLNYRFLAANTLQLGWPVTLSGFTLESATDLVVPGWKAVTNDVVDINTEHTVTLSAAQQGQLFRLKK